MIIHSLSLLSPLFYTQEEDDPFKLRGKAEPDSAGEKLFCFDLDEKQYLSFEPDKFKLLGKLVFSGASAAETELGAKNQLELPRGNYLFAQKREILNKDEIIALAIEIQLEGLWQRLEFGKRLYLRYLFEDESWVTQLFRPYF